MPGKKGEPLNHLFDPIHSSPMAPLAHRPNDSIQELDLSRLDTQWTHYLSHWQTPNHGIPQTIELFAVEAQSALVGLHTVDMCDWCRIEPPGVELQLCHPHPCSPRQPSHLVTPDPYTIAFLLVYDAFHIPSAGPSCGCLFPNASQDLHILWVLGTLWFHAPPLLPRNATVDLACSCNSFSCWWCACFLLLTSMFQPLRSFLKSWNLRG